MKTYTITVNGNVYNVTVEEGQTSGAPAAAPVAAPKAAPAAAPKAAVPAAGAGAVKVTASVPGKVVKVAASVGQAVKAGDSVIILESMTSLSPHHANRTNAYNCAPILYLLPAYHTPGYNVLPNDRESSPSP